MSAFRRLLRSLREPVERIPLLAESYRLVRDHVSFRRWKPRPTRLGFKLSGDAKMAAGEFEPVETQLLGTLMETADVFVDVGANVGYYSCLARSKGLAVVAVEPGASVFRFLLSNLVANGMRDVEVFPVGLSDRVEIAVLYGGGGSASLIAGWSRSSEVYSATIPTTTLDHLVAGRFFGQRLLVKIDIEGMEYACLRGGEATLMRSPAPTWFVEIYLDDGHPEGLNPHFQNIFELFWKHGYTAREALPGGSVVVRSDVERYLTANGRPRTPNYLFSKSA